jgi:hypothetical protein
MNSQRECSFEYFIEEFLKIIDSIKEKGVKMSKKICVIVLVVCFFLGVFCLEVLSSEQQSKLKNSGEGISKRSGATECDPSSITVYKYLMTFQACSGDVCNDPRNHTVYLAGSDDGINWSLIEEFEPIPGSVPDLIFYNNSLYIFHTPGASTFHWHKLNQCFEIVDMGSTMIEGPDGMTGGFVDPSMIVSGDDLIMFYLPGVLGGDPAGCDVHPCTKEIHSAVADNEDVRSFIQQDGNRVSMYIKDEEAEIQLFCDPDILRFKNGSYLLYISIGGSTLVYQDTALSGTFVSPDDPDLVVISNVGGVPGSIQAPDGSIWLYVNKNSPEGTKIARGVSNDGVMPIDDNDFTTVIDYTISDDFTTDTSTGSPSIISWPEWSDTSTTTTTIKLTTTTTTVPITTTTTKKGICISEFIYGEGSEEVEFLKYLRDKVLGKTPEGQEIIRLYYEWSPVIIKTMKQDKEFKEGVKALVDEILLLIGE